MSSVPTKAQITRAITAARAAGLEVVAVKIHGDKVEIITSDGTKPVTDMDKFFAEKQAS